MIRTSRRLLLAAVAGGALLLSGCAASTDASGTAADGDVATVEAPEDDYFFLGDKPIPAEPTRIVALWRTGSSLAELGAPVVGQLEGELSETEMDPALWADYSDIPTVGTYEGVDIEELIALEPDLVIGMDHGGISIDYEEIAELFPVAVLQIAEPTDVWDNYGTVAALAGLHEDFAAEEKALEARLADIQTEFGDTLGTRSATSVGVMADQIWVDTSKALSFRRIDAAGFGYNPTYTDNPERYVTELSRENIPSLADQDVVFYDAEIDGSVSAEVQALLDEPAFAQLPAVQGGTSFPLRGATVYTFFAANLMVDDLTAAAESLAG